MFDLTNAKGYYALYIVCIRIWNGMNKVGKQRMAFNTCSTWQCVYKRTAASIHVKIEIKIKIKNYNILLF